MRGKILVLWVTLVFLLGASGISISACSAERKDEKNLEISSGSEKNVNEIETISIVSSLSEINKDSVLSKEPDLMNPMAEDAERVGEIDLDESKLTDGDISSEDILEIELFEESYRIPIDEITKRDETITGRGGVLNTDFGFMTLSCEEEKVSMTIEIAEENKQYAIRYNEDFEGHYLYENSLDELNKLESTSLNPSDEIPINQNSDEEVSLEEYLSEIDSPELETNETSMSDVDNSEDTEIDVMVVYTERAADWAEEYEGGIGNAINEAHQRANTVVDNSEVGITFNLVHTGQVDYEETDRIGRDMFRLIEPVSYMREVHHWRDEHDADLVSLFTNSPDYDWGGISSKIHYEWQLSPWFGFSISQIWSASRGFTHIHEIGHNLGAGHHKEQDTQPGPRLYDYSAGWRDPYLGISTVMCYSSGNEYDDGVSTTTIPYFSNPDITYNGVLIGDPEDADNARTLRETKGIVSEYSEGTYVNQGDLATGATIFHGIGGWIYGAYDSLRTILDDVRSVIPLMLARGKSLGTDHSRG